MKQIDRIRNMNVEELAGWIDRFVKDCSSCPLPLRFCKTTVVNLGITCKDRYKTWLESEVEE